MSNPVQAELYVPLVSLRAESVYRLLNQLVALRLLAPEFRSSPRHYGRFDRDPFEEWIAPLSESLEILSTSGNCIVFVDLEREAMRPGAREFLPTLSFSVSDADAAHGLGMITLDMSAAASSASPSLYGEFLALTRLVAEMTDAVYGWAATEIKAEYAPVSVANVAALDLQPLEWANIYGHAYVERIGYERLISTPCHRVDILASGGVMVTLGPAPYRVGWDVAAAVTAHLGLPTVPGSPT